MMSTRPSSSNGRLSSSLNTLSTTLSKGTLGLRTLMDQPRRRRRLLHQVTLPRLHLLPDRLRREYCYGNRLLVDTYGGYMLLIYAYCCSCLQALCLDHYVVSKYDASLRATTCHLRTYISCAVRASIEISRLPLLLDPDLNLHDFRGLDATQCARAMSPTEFQLECPRTLW